MTHTGALGPQRTCVGCRQRRFVKQDRMVCVVLVADQVQAVLSRRQRPSGRGAWLCPSAKCVLSALHTRAFSRTFRRAVGVPPADELIAQVMQHAGS